MGLLAPGSVVAGCRIESVVGRGGMGVVYRARELELGRVVALKLIAPELLEAPGIRERFLKEARTAAAIEHPNVVPVYAAGERDGAAYLVMRFIDGDDLRTLVLRDGPLTPSRAAETIGRVAAGLDVIHRAGYVHRDVKPANVLVDGDGHVYVTDFGLAKQVLSRGGATAPGHWVGTLDYVAPEQVRGERVDARADVYALGGVLCFVLTGQVPFDRDGDQAKLWAQLSSPPPQPSTLHADVPAAFDAIVERAMAKDPEARYPSAGDLGRAAAAVASGRVPSQPERMVARGAAAAPGETPIDDDGPTLTATRPAPVSARTRPPPRARRSRRVVLATIAALAVAAIVTVLVSRGDPPAVIRVGETIADVGRRPTGVVVAEGTLWVTSATEPTVERVDGATGRDLEPRPQVGLGAVGIVHAGTSVWVASKAARRVVRIDARSGRVHDSVRPGGVPTDLAVGLGSVWVATTGHQLVRYDDSGAVRERHPMARGVAALTTGADAVWIAERDPPNLVRLDPRTGDAVEWASLGALPSALYYAGGWLWATFESESILARIDPRRRGTVTKTAAGQRPQQMVAAGGHLFVASYLDHTVLVFDLRTGKQVGAPLDVEANPYAVAAGDGSVWVTGVGENTLTRVLYR